MFATHVGTIHHLVSIRVIGTGVQDRKELTDSLNAQGTSTNRESTMLSINYLYMKLPVEIPPTGDRNVKFVTNPGGL